MRLRVFLISLMVLVLGFVGVVWYVLSRPLPKLPPLALPPSCTVEALAPHVRAPPVAKLRYLERAARECQRESRRLLGVGGPANRAPGCSLPGMGG